MCFCPEGLVFLSNKPLRKLS